MKQGSKPDIQNVLVDNDTLVIASIVAPIAERPPPAALRHLVRERSLTAEFEPAWAAKPLALIRDKERTILIIAARQRFPGPHSRSKPHVCEGPSSTNEKYEGAGLPESFEEYGLPKIERSDDEKRN